MLQHENIYRFYYFYSYINPGFLPLFLNETRCIFTKVDSNTCDCTASHQKYQAWLSGQAPEELNYDEKCIEKPFIEPSIEENYSFVHKHFGLKWCLAIFLIRILKNLKHFNELKYLFRPLNSTLFSKPQPILNIEKVKMNVSVVIPTKNRRRYLNHLLTQLNTQSILPAEVIIVDQSDKFIPIDYKSFSFKLVHISDSNPGQASGKNAGIRIANSEYILQLDDDVSIHNNLIEEHLNCIHLNNADISTGSYIKKGRIQQAQSAFSIASHLPAGNSMVKKIVYQEVGLYNDIYDHLPIEDTDFYVRCVQKKKRIIHSKATTIIHHEAKTGGMRSRLLDSLPITENIKWLNPLVWEFYQKILPKKLFIKMLLLLNFHYFKKAISSRLFIINIPIHILIMPYYFYKVFRINEVYLEKTNPNA